MQPSLERVRSLQLMKLNWQNSMDSAIWPGHFARRFLEFSSQPACPENIGKHFFGNSRENMLVNNSESMVLGMQILLVSVPLGEREEVLVAVGPLASIILLVLGCSNLTDKVGHILHYKVWDTLGTIPAFGKHQKMFLTRAVA